LAYGIAVENSLARPFKNYGYFTEFVNCKGINLPHGIFLDSFLGVPLLLTEL
jgi:hypothetical protein